MLEQSGTVEISADVLLHVTIDCKDKDAQNCNAVLDGWINFDHFVTDWNFGHKRKNYILLSKFGNCLCSSNSNYSRISRSQNNTTKTAEFYSSGGIL